MKTTRLMHGANAAICQTAMIDAIQRPLVREPNDFWMTVSLAFYLATSISFAPVTLPASGPRSKVIWMVYLPSESLGTRHECEQKPPHEKPVVPCVTTLPSGPSSTTSAFPSARRESPSLPSVHAERLKD
jgi:hypothetical protein